MRWINAAAQCVADFLVEERCHACARRIRGAEPPAEGRTAASALAVVTAGPLVITTRLLCADCAARMRPWHEPVVLAAAADRATHRTPPHPLHAYPAWETDDRLLLIIHLLKFRRRARLAPWLGRQMAGSLPARARDGLSHPAVLVPVPMDRASRARRGFNQAELIAEELGRSWDLPVLARALVKRRATRPQSALGRDERMRNLEGAFAAGPHAVAGKAVLLVDDLVTTGATAGACARLLAGAGAATVRVVCAGYRP